MFYSIYGTVCDKTDNWIILECGNFEFEISTLSRDDYILLRDYKIYIYSHINADNETKYYGFLNIKDLCMFKKMLKIQGIGCKTAINILNLIKADYLIKLIKEENFIELRSIIGVKANTLILNLKRDLEKIPADLTKYEGIATALKNLGYRNDQISKIISNIDLTLPLDEALKQSLKIINL